MTATDYCNKKGVGKGKAGSKRTRDFACDTDIDKSPQLHLSFVLKQAASPISIRTGTSPCFSFLHPTATVQAQLSEQLRTVQLYRLEAARISAARVIAAF